ncbi:MAG TPA: glycosyltransferase family 4 protein, partial [Verrucomicrobiae bacterium]|nr:glycosyltransferase family 4 protein [Verrucomicrobiae bacterium]
GGKAVADYLIREWREKQPFPLTVLSPRSLGLFGNNAPSSQAAVAALLRSADGCGDNQQNRRFAEAPRQRPIPKSLAAMSELEYARFCREFERAATNEILKRDPKRCVVLSNDISEGPDFRALGERGYRIVTIFHVDVVEYFTRFYLRGVVRPEALARFHWFRLMPDVLRLVFEKQYECVRNSARIVVPSAPMKDVILRCYPWCPTEKIVVLPWGNIAAEAKSNSAVIDRPYSIAEDEIVIITLSRLSPEKGIERLLTALPFLNTSGRKARVFICGGAAYMNGRKYEKRLRRVAAKVTNVPIEFTGHVVADQKAALLQRADIFVSPSKHESYGLTIAEALSAGCRVVSHRHYGAEGAVVDCSDPRALARVLSGMIAEGRTPKTRSGTCTPSQAAGKLADLLAAISELPGEPSRH